MRFFHNEYREKARTNIITAAIIVLMLAFFYYLKNITSFFAALIGLASPFLLGIALCFIQVPVVNRLDRLQERFVFKKKKHPKITRAISTVLSHLLLLAIIAAMAFILLPQVFHSVKQLIPIITNFIQTNSHWIGETLQQFDVDFITFDGSELNIAWEQILVNFSDYITPVFDNVLNISSSIYRFFFNFFIGFITSFYIMMSKEVICARAKKLCYAFLPENLSPLLVHWSRRASAIFSGFIIGKLLDSFVIGVICYISMLLMRLEYPLLISFIVGIFNIIPFFGPIIGAIPSILILLIIDPKHALIFAIYVLILQQMDGNIIGPAIMRDHVGISSLWIMVSIIIGGGLFGFIGMLLSVPMFSLIYAIVKAWSEYRLKNKGLPVNGASYFKDPEIPKHAEQ